MPDCLLCPECDQPLAELDVVCPQCGRIVTPELPRSLVRAPRAGGNAVSSHRADLDAKWAARRTAGSDAMSLHKAELDEKWLARHAASEPHTLARHVQPARHESTGPTNSGTELRSIAASQLQVECEASPFMSYALRLSGKAAVRRLTIKNLGYRTIPNLLVTVSMQPGGYGPPWTAIIDKLAPGQPWEQKEFALELDTERLRRVIETEPASLKVTVSTGAEMLYSGEPAPMPVYPYNQWVRRVDGYMSLELTAAFVQPNDPALFHVMDLARDRLDVLAGRRSFSGYQSNDIRYVWHMLESIHDAVLKAGVSYINPMPSFEDDGQKVRLVAQTLTERAGTCIDLAVLQAALWEKVGLAPMIVVVPGHALLACWLREPDRNRPVVKTIRECDRDAINRTLDMLKRAPLAFINSVEVASGGSFDAAKGNGLGYIEGTIAAGDSVHLIDISAARAFGLKPLP